MTLSKEEVQYAHDYIVKAGRPEDLFGDLGGGGVNVQLDKLHHLYHEQSVSLNPDQYTDPHLHKLVTEAFQVLTKAKSDAELMIKNGTYGKVGLFSSHDPEVVDQIELPDHRYLVSDQFIAGDFCQVIMAQREDSSGTENVCLKIPLNPRDNDLLINEARVLTQIQHKSLPVLLESIVVNDKQVNVLRRINGGLDLVSVRSIYTNGLPQEHVVWIADRVLSVLGFMHTNKIIHGSVEPSNIVIVPDTHNGVLIDMLLSVVDANQPGARYLGTNHYSAPEILTNKLQHPHPSTDMYSLGKTVLYLLGGDIDRQIFPSDTDPRLKMFFEKFLDSDPRRRPGDAWESWHQLRQLRQQVFGAATQFLPLNIG